MRATLREPALGWWDHKTGKRCPSFPVFNEVYEVVGIEFEGGLLGLFFAEFPVSFEASEFRPVKTTDISLFHRMLAPKPKKRAKEST